MEMHHFIAKDMRSGLQLVYEKLGPDALIISNRSMSNGIEIQAAIERQNDEILPTPSANESGISRHINTSDPVRMIPETSLKNLESEMKLLRQILETQVHQLTKQHENYNYPMHAVLIEQLQQFGFSPDFTHNIISELHDFASVNEGLEQLKNNLIKQLHIPKDDILKTGGILALVGPTGVGKTTMLAKLATQYATLHGSDSVTIVNTDNYRVAAREQVSNYANILEIDAYHVHNISEIPTIFSKLSDKKLILIDTSGVVLQSSEIVSRLDFLKQHRNFQCYLTVSASTSTDTLSQTVDLFSYLSLAGCVLTKLDETLKIAPALSVLIEKQLPVAYLSTGQRVPDDFELARDTSLIHQAFTPRGNRHHKTTVNEVVTC